MPSNIGKPYTKYSIMRIKSLANHGVSVTRIAVIMGRSVGGISILIRELRRMDMLMHGNDNDTLKTYKPSTKIRNLTNEQNTRSFDTHVN